MFGFNSENYSSSKIKKKKKKVKLKNSSDSNKILLIMGVLLIVIVLISLLFGMNSGGVYTLELKGDNSVVVYKGTNYNDPGAIAYDESNNDLSSSIKVNSNLDTSRVGTYEITYILGDVNVTRKVKVVDRNDYNNSNSNNSNNNSGNSSNNIKPPIQNEKAETTLKLKGESTVYIDLYGTYKEEGYYAHDTKDGVISKKVEVTHNVDNKKVGTYEIVYTVKNSEGVTSSIKRKVVVMDVSLKLSASNVWTNQNTPIKVVVEDQYMDYVVMPDGKTTADKEFTYNVTSNGTYKFTLYNKYGIVKESSITINNIDKTAPTVSCTAEYNNGLTTVNVTSNDNEGIHYYKLNDKYYNVNKIVLGDLSKNNTITAYDKAGNTATATCNITSAVYLDNISKDGVIVTVKATPVNTDIAGYYFSYTNQRPDKNTGGYVATNKNTLDVVRLPGKTYVWVEDSRGMISNVKSISIGNEALFYTNNKNYKILQGTSLENYLSSQGWSLSELDKLIARSVRAAGLYSNEAIATAGVALQTVLAQKYKIKIPYWWGGKSWDFGATASWGTNKAKFVEKNDAWYYYYGMDCTGFVTWAYVNAGYNIKKGQYPPYGNTVKFTKENGEVGDVITSPGHVQLIVGKNSTGFIVAEASGRINGMIVRNVPYSNSANRGISKRSVTADRYGKVSRNACPMGV